MRSSGESNRSQFQIGKARVSPPGVGRAGIHPRRKRSTRLPTACASSLAQALCLLGTGRANPPQAGLPVPPKLVPNQSPLTTSFSNRHILELEFDLTPSIVSNLKFSDRHTFSVFICGRSDGASRTLPNVRARLQPCREEQRRNQGFQPLRPQRLKRRLLRPCTARLKACPDANHESRFTNHCLSNRNTLETGIAVTYSKQTTAVLSNRNKKPSPGGVASWLPPSTSLDPSNRYTVRIEIAVTPTKQTTAALSNRYKKPSPPGGVPRC
jgi:hypothetical protein